MASIKAFANVSASQTDSQLVASVSGQAIRVISVVVQAGGTATDITFNTKAAGSSGTAISPLFSNAAHGALVLSYNQDGWFQTNSGEALTVTTGSGSATGIQISYVLV